MPAGSLIAMRPVLFALPCLVALALPASAQAVTVAVGDADGFGIDPTGLVRAEGTHTEPADVDGDGIIEVGEYLPDWNANGFDSPELAINALLVGPDGLSGMAATDADNGSLGARPGIGAA